MKFKPFVKLGLGLIKHPYLTALALSVKNNKDEISLDEGIRRAADWLIVSQLEAPDGEGYSRKYSLIYGWDKCYIETTGYIIPTLLDMSRHLRVEKYRDSAFKAANWLLSVQNEDGAFTDIDNYSPQVFDTGQVLLGLNRMFRETDDERYRDSMIRAGRWLFTNQEENGSWIKYAYNNRPHSYYTRVAAALIEAGVLSGIDEFIEAGVRNLEWALSQRQANGYFKYSEFKSGEDAILHTIVYVLEGYSLAYNIIGDQRWADALIEGVSVLSGLVNEHGMLCSQYDPEWRATNAEYCVTGLAQYAGVCFDVSTITGNKEIQDQGSQILKQLCYWQQIKGADVRGSLQSSVPLWGYYGGMEFFNWNTKFFIDAGLKKINSPVQG